jgi:site-specific DNA recombinase
MVNAKTVKPSVLSGFVICANCLTQMQRSKTTKDGRVHYYFRCKTNKQLGPASCTSHLIAEDVITEILLESISSLIDSFVDVEAALRRNANNEAALLRKRLQHQLDAAITEQERIANTKAHVFHAYINKLDETLTDEAYINLRDNFNRMGKENKERILSLKQELEKLKKGDEYMTDFMLQFGQYKGISELTREIVASLVERILIYDDKGIRIEFKFADEILKYALPRGDLAMNG